jgi:hypothetical protein
MKFIILLLTLSACTPHWSVERVTKTKCEQETETLVQYECRYQSRFSAITDTLKICVTAEECNDFCNKVAGR